MTNLESPVTKQLTILESSESPRADVVDAVRSLSQLGKKGAGAIPALCARLTQAIETRDRGLMFEIVRALHEIPFKSEIAVPVLNQVVQSHRSDGALVRDTARTIGQYGTAAAPAEEILDKLLERWRRGGILCTDVTLKNEAIQALCEALVAINPNSPKVVEYKRLGDRSAREISAEDQRERGVMDAIFGVKQEPDSLDEG
ncbi:MAG: hypothetical protein DCC75_07260 [Proteobacteria bacterium]|nr:MAG: hypothetical protein DCC75_07260 [Pseudomonadota bacterium]